MSRWTLQDVVAAQTRGELVKSQFKRMVTQATPSKYGNKKTGKYASKREAKRAQELKAMQAAGEIANLREQVKYELIPPQRDEQGKLLERGASYVADFVYVNPGYRPFLDMDVVEDVKGMRTNTYILKRKLMLKVHGIRIREV